MLATPKILQLHVPKTGGTWLRRYLTNTTEGPKIFSDHRPGFVATEQFPGREVWATIRHPLGWYASVWRQAYATPGMHEPLERWGRGSREFEAVLYGWTHPWELPESAFHPLFFGKIPFQERVCRENRLGLCTFVHSYILAPLSDVKEGRIDVSRWFPDRYFWPRDLHYLAPGQPAANTSDSRTDRPPEPKYTQEQIFWVLESDSLMTNQLMRTHYGA